MVLRRSRVACRRASNDDDELCGWRTPLNMTLYRSILILGISTLSKGPLSWGSWGSGGGEGSGAGCSFSARLALESPLRARNDILRPRPPELGSLTGFGSFVDFESDFSLVSFLSAVVLMGVDIDCSG